LKEERNCLPVDLVVDEQWIKLGEGEDANPPMVRNVCKESAEDTIRNLAGFCVSADKVTGSKEVRADPFAAQVQAGNVHLIAGQ
jgi:hypothetical protein